MDTAIQYLATTHPHRADGDKVSDTLIYLQLQCFFGIVRASVLVVGRTAMRDEGRGEYS